MAKEQLATIMGNLPTASSTDLTADNSLLIKVGNQMKSLPADKVASSDDIKVVVSRVVNDEGFVLGLAHNESVQQVPWCINEKINGTITALSVYVPANSQVNVIKVNENATSTTLVSSVHNSDDVSKWIDVSFESSPVDCDGDEYVGIMSATDTDKVYLIGSATYTGGHTRTFKFKNNKWVTNQTTDKWAIGLILKTKSSELVSNVVQEMIDSESGSEESIDLCDYTLIPVYGQSLSIGDQSTPAITTTPSTSAGLMIGDSVCQKQKTQAQIEAMDFSDLKEVTRETLASGCCEKILDIIQRETGLSKKSDYWKSHKLIFVSCGDGSKTIEQLMSNTSTDDTPTLYEGLVNAIKGIVSKVVNAGKSINVPAFVWIQGENDQKMNYQSTHDNYKTALTNLQSQIDAIVKSANGQSNDVVCVCYQSCAQGYLSVSKPAMANITYSTTKQLMGCPSAQMELVRDSEKFCASVPCYALEHHVDDSVGANIHLTNLGEKQLGGYCGVSIARILLGKTSYKGVCPTTYSVVGNEIIVKYSAQTELSFDTSFVCDDGFKGYKVLNSSSQNIITSVSVFDNEIKLTCSESPVGCIMSYGENWAVGYDGRRNGSRGNVRDSYGYDESIVIDGKKYLLNGYAYCFVCDVIAGTDNEVKY